MVKLLKILIEEISRMNREKILELNYYKPEKQWK